MRFYFILLSALIFSGNAIAQGNSFQSQSPYTGHLVNNFEVVLPTYNSGGDVEGKPFFSKDWVRGSVKTIMNEEFSDKLLFLYDKVGGKLFFKNDDSATIMEADRGMTYSFTLITDKPHIFMRGDLFSKDYNGKFFEALVFNDKNYSLLKYTTTNFEQTTTSKASQAMTQTISAGRYVDKETYFLFFNNTLQPVELKKKAFPKALNNADCDKAEAYIKMNNGNFNEAYASKLIESLNIH
jgi:hypothetical protein